MKILVECGYGKLILPADENLGTAMASLAKAEMASECGPWDNRCYRVDGRPEIKIIEDDKIIRDGEEQGLRSTILKLDKEKDALISELSGMKEKIKKAGIKFDEQEAK